MSFLNSDRVLNSNHAQILFCFLLSCSSLWASRTLSIASVYLVLTQIIKYTYVISVHIYSFAFFWCGQFFSFFLSLLFSFSYSFVFLVVLQLCCSFWRRGCLFYKCLCFLFHCFLFLSLLLHLLCLLDFLSSSSRFLRRELGSLCWESHLPKIHS